MPDSAMVRNLYVISNIDECIDLLGDRVAFSTLDENSGYRRIEIRDTDLNEIGFTANNGQYRFVHKPARLKNIQGRF